MGLWPPTAHCDPRLSPRLAPVEVGNGWPRSRAWTWASSFIILQWSSMGLGLFGWVLKQLKPEFFNAFNQLELWCVGWLPGLPMVTQASLAASPGRPWPPLWPTIWQRMAALALCGLQGCAWALELVSILCFIQALFVHICSFFLISFCCFETRNQTLRTS